MEALKTDEVRGFAVLCMIFYHAFYILGTTFGYGWATELFYFFMPVQPLFAGLFIFICGVSCSLSKSNLKRGLKILAVAGVVTLFTAVVMPLFGFVECEIYFGILHLLSVCVLLCAALEKTLGRISPFVGILVCAVMYPFMSGISSGVLGYGELISVRLPDALYQTDWLVPFGIYSSDFFSADYFPIFPSVFIFFAGVFAGMQWKRSGFPEWAYPQRSKFFGFLGRKALWIYIAHMPLVYALTELIRFVAGMVAA